jgi:HEAT repeat protein
LDAIVAEHTEHAPDPIRRLIAKLSDEDRFERVEAARQLGRLGPEATAAVPALLRALGHQDKWLRVAAAQALGSLGPAAEPVGPVAFALRRAMQDEDPDVRNAAAEALQKV